MLVIQDMPSLRLLTPDAAQQAEFQRQLEMLIKQQRNYPSIWTWVSNTHSGSFRIGS